MIRPSARKLMDLLDDLVGITLFLERLSLFVRGADLFRAGLAVTPDVSRDLPSVSTTRQISLGGDDEILVDRLGIAAASASVLPARVASASDARPRPTHRGRPEGGELTRYVE